LEQADLLALPCVVAADGDRDSMPVVVKEALAMGVPVVGSDEVGMPEMVRSDWGRLVPPRDSRALAEAIAGLLALAPEERAAMGRRGREFVARSFSIRGEAQKLIGLIERYDG
jgi:glycosyltransferase involved in cell wall biosynthesis